MLVAFAWATWIYRLVLFLGIAVLVYHFFIKLVGIFLFLVEIVWFVAKPLAAELAVWRKIWPQIRSQTRSRRTAWILVGLCVLSLIPWPGRITASAVLRPQHSWPVFAPAGARVDAVFFQHGETVPSGQALMDLYVPDLFSREKILQARWDQQRWQAATSAFDEDMRKRWKVAEQNLQMTQVELQGVEAERHQFKPTAPFDGTLQWVDPDLAVGQWVGKKEPLVVLVQLGSKWRVETWLDEDDVGRVHLGNSARFLSDSPAAHILNLTVTAIDRDAARVLPRRELASAVGGHVLTREKNGQLIPERAVYRVSMDVDVMPSFMQQQSWRGSVIVESDTQIPISRYARQVMSVLMREMGF